MFDIEVDPTVNILHRESSELNKIFFPKNIAVIGATERDKSVGKTLLLNLLKEKSFEKNIYPVNPKRREVLGIKAYENILKVPVDIDLAIIATPAKTVPDIIADCVKKDVSSAIIVSAGFKELGKPGVLLEEEIKKHIKNKRLRIIGPNCLGVMNPINGLNATFAADMALKGNVAFISQSGALCTAVLDWSLKEKIGFSAFVSIGSMMDVDWGDLINYFGNDENTKSILLYMESVGNPRSFLSAAKEVSLTKPIIVIKAGKTKESALAASSHTGALTGSDEVLNAAFRRVGVLRVNSISDLFYMAEILSKQPRPKGPNLSIITNAGGPGVIATDALIQSGGKLSKISKGKMDELNEILPNEWSHNNPIDILGDATPEVYYKTVEIASKDENSDGILVILTPQYMTDPKGVANILKPFSKNLKKPLLASFMGEEKIEEGSEILADSNIPNFPYPDVACEAFSYMWTYSYNLREIYETPLIRDEEEEKILKKREKVSEIFENVLNDKRTLLNECESKEVLKVFDIPIVLTKIAKSEEEAKKIAKDIGFPVVLKVYSKTITHKSDVGGVKLDLKSEKEVGKAFQEIYNSVKKILKEGDFQGVTVQKMVSQSGYELILGSSTDSQFGPVILFGTGGKLVEVFKDRALALPPLNSTLANRLMERTKVFKALKGVRGEKGINLDFLETILIRFSKLISEYPIIKECDINPLLATPDEIIVLDARIVLYGKEDKRVNLAIRPYPVEHIKSSSTKEGIPIKFRPIKPEDEILVSNFLETLSKETVFRMFLKKLDYTKLFVRKSLIKMCFTDYDREMTLTAEVESEGEKNIIALCRLIKILNTEDAVFSMVVKDSWQGKGVGSNFLKYLVDVAKKEKIKRIKAKILKENFIMQKIFKKLNFKMRESRCGKMIYVELDLTR